MCITFLTSMFISCQFCSRTSSPYHIFLSHFSSFDALHSYHFIFSFCLLKFTLWCYSFFVEQLTHQLMLMCFFFLTVSFFHLHCWRDCFLWCSFFQDELVSLFPPSSSTWPLSDRKCLPYSWCIRFSLYSG